jgi:hypothetical protein
VLAFRFDKNERIAPQVSVAVHDGRIEAATHRGRTRDRKCAGALRNIDFDVDDGLGAVARSWNARVLKPWLDRGLNHIGGIVATL